MIQHSTLVAKNGGDTFEIASSLGTMVINDDTDENDEDTMKRKNFYNNFPIKITTTLYSRRSYVKVNFILGWAKEILLILL
jgi:hypothetical protein